MHTVLLHAGDMPHLQVGIASRSPSTPGTSALSSAGPKDFHLAPHRGNQRKWAQPVTSGTACGATTLTRCCSCGSFVTSCRQNNTSHKVDTDSPQIAASRHRLVSLDLTMTHRTTIEQSRHTRPSSHRAQFPQGASSV